MENRLLIVEREISEVNAKLDRVGSAQIEQGRQIDQAEKQLSIINTKLNDLDLIKNILVKQGLSRSTTTKEVKTEVQVGNVHSESEQINSADKKVNLSTPAKVGLGAAVIATVSAFSAWVGNYFTG